MKRYETRGKAGYTETCKSDKQENFDSRFLDVKNGKHLAMKLGYERKTSNREESGLKDKSGVLQRP